MDTRNVPGSDPREWGELAVGRFYTDDETLAEKDMWALAREVATYGVARDETLRAALVARWKAYIAEKRARLTALWVAAVDAECDLLAEAEALAAQLPGGLTLAEVPMPRRYDPRGDRLPDAGWELRAGRRVVAGPFYLADLPPELRRLVGARTRIAAANVRAGDTAGGPLAALRAELPAGCR